MGDHGNRQCLNRLLSISTQTEGMDHHSVANEVDRMLDCNGRQGCGSHLACSWLAVELAGRLAQRYR